MKWQEGIHNKEFLTLVSTHLMSYHCKSQWWHYPLYWLYCVHHNRPSDVCEARWAKNTRWSGWILQASMPNILISALATVVFPTSASPYLMKNIGMWCSLDMRKYQRRNYEYYHYYDMYWCDWCTVKFDMIEIIQRTERNLLQLLCDVSDIMACMWLYFEVLRT